MYRVLTLVVQVREMRVCLDNHISENYYHDDHAASPPYLSHT